MTYTQLESIDNFGLRSFLNFPNLDTPIFYPLFMFVLFFVFTSLTFFREVRREGKGNILSSLAVAGYVTTAISVILSLLDLMDNTIVITILVISLIFQAIYLLTDRN